MADKRELIIQAAVKVLEKENYATMRTLTIAQEAGIAEGTIYRYFANKRELFKEVIRYINQRLRELLFQGISADMGLRENLEMLGIHFLFQEGEARTLYKIFYKAFSEVDDPEVREVLGEIYHTAVEVIQNILVEGSNKSNLVLSPDKARMMAIVLWALGDFFWKKRIVSPENTVDIAEMKGLVTLFMSIVEK